MSECLCPGAGGIEPDCPIHGDNVRSAASGFDREAMIAAVRERGTPTSVHDLFECIGKAGREIAAAIRDGDNERGEGACSAFLNAIEMMPASLREDIATAATERPGLAEWPDLREFAHGD